ncbi:MAG: hypothetical protein ACJ8C4_01045 [Gemmataceae bacterium]
MMTASLRLALVLGLLAFVPSTGWAGEPDDSVEVMVKKLGGSVTRNNQLPGNPLGSVILSMSDVTDADLKSLAGLKAITYLGLYRTNITDAGLKEIAGLKTLQRIDVMKTKITDAGLKQLSGLTALEGLELATTKSTAPALRIWRRSNHCSG